MDSKFSHIDEYHRFERLLKEPFDKKRLEEAFKTLLDMTWDRDEFAIAGSAALYVLSVDQVNRGKVPLITRMPNDIDILITGNSAQRAKDMGVVTDSGIGGAQIKLELGQNKGDLLDLTTHWPTGGVIRNANELKQVTIDVGGLRVMVPEMVLNLKERFNRVKDRPDLETALVAHRTSANPFPVKPKAKL